MTGVVQLSKHRRERNPPTEAIQNLLGYLVSKELLHFVESCADGYPTKDHIMQEIITVQKWLGGELWDDMKADLEEHGLVELPSGLWGNLDET
jgi:hypothetical protein